MQDPRSDDQLMELIKAGDKLAFRVLFGRHSRLVLGYCLRILGGNRSAAEDVGQEVWVKVARRADRYEGRGTFKSWLMRITRNEAIDSIRAQMPASEYEEGEANDADPGPGVEEALIDLGESERVKTAVDRLPAPQRAVLSLWISESLTYEQIATELGMTPPAVRSHLSRARQSLRKKLETA